MALLLSWWAPASPQPDRPAWCSDRNDPEAAGRGISRDTRPFVSTLPNTDPPGTANSPQRTRNCPRRLALRLRTRQSQVWTRVRRGPEHANQRRLEAAQPVAWKAAAGIRKGTESAV